MQSGQYITERYMVEMIRQISEEKYIDFKAYSGDWLLELVKNGRRARILGYKFSLNDSVAANIAQDKVAAYQMLRKEGVSAVEHMLLRTKATPIVWPALADAVIKPLSGTSGHAVHRVASREEAEDIMASTGIEAWAISPYQEIVREIRAVVLYDEILLSYEKEPVQENGLKFFNLGKGATAVDCTLSQSESVLVKAAQAALGLKLAAIDIVELASGEKKILEVNDGIMMENYARQSLENRNKTYGVYEAVVGKLLYGEDC
jgi:glutathione synthase/RimK-type ligase-like ATP-grasp enzyme